MKKSKQHSFDIEEADKYGIKEAILLANIRHWLDKNKANGSNIYDGRVWTYNSHKAFSELFPYMSAKQIRTALNKLSDAGILITGNYNKSAYDRTLWYTIDEPAYLQDAGDKTRTSISPNGRVDLTNASIPFAHMGSPIPDINTDSKPDINTLSMREREVQEILDTWNDLYGCRLRLSKTRASHIAARLKTYEAEAIKTAMSNRLANRYWDTPAGRPHRNNIDSFIRNDDQVDKYLNQESTQEYTRKEEMPF